MPDTEQPSRSGADWSPWLSWPRQAGALTDYDGTLAPIVVDRGKAAPLAGAREVIAALASRLALVAVVSGRPVDYLCFHLGGIPGAVLVGLYGLERSEGGKRSLSEGALEWQEVVSGCARAAEKEVPAGVDIEFKGLSLALHVRRHPEVLDWVTSWSRERAGETGLLFQPGRLSVELLPPVATDKGTVVEELAAGLDAICFFGDDTGDLPAFAALRRLRVAGKATVAVGVQSPEQPETLAAAVDILVDGPAAAVELLRMLAGGADALSGRQP